jgi:AbrB family looped-hinge helix DNA binding protein
MPIVRILAKGQVVIPKEIRQALGIVPGTKLHVRVEGKEVVFCPLPADPIQAMCGMAKGGPSLTKALLEDRRQEREHEEKKFARFLRRSRRGAVGKPAG